MRRLHGAVWLLLAALSFSLSSCSTSPARGPDAQLPSVYEQPAAADIQTVNLPRAQPPQGPFQPNANLFTCHRQISNHPRASASGQIENYSPVIVAFGVVLASAPVNDVCLSSGFGPRFGRMHKGIDLFSASGGTIYSAAPGRILEISGQTGFGNQMVIAHAEGVFTRYAHMASFAPGLSVGDTIGFGVPLGTMGRTGNATGIHLHYEILTGDYDNPRRSFGLEAHNPLDFPAWTNLDNSD